LDRAPECEKSDGPAANLFYAAFSSSDEEEEEEEEVEEVGERGNRDETIVTNAGDVNEQLPSIKIDNGNITVALKRQRSTYRVNDAVDAQDREHNWCVDVLLRVL
jgi:hypothetical protein